MKVDMEESLALKLSNEPEKAMSILYKNYYNQLYKTAYGILKDHTLSSDAMQESFIKIWENRDKYNPKAGRLYTWMLKIVKNKTIDIQRSFNLRNFREDSIDNQDYNFHLEAPVEKELDKTFIHHHIRSLRLPYQSVLNALYFRGLSELEASVVLGVPLGTIKSRKRIAIRELRKIYLK